MDVCCKKNIHKKEGEMEREEGRSPYHKLNIIDSITNGIIPLVTPSVMQ
jgi:hypothetical protein